ncbi:DET1-like protein [Sarcoptes scabiei]|nr:DET1-like protein [Sarcoptes scabiei]
MRSSSNTIQQSINATLHLDHHTIKNNNNNNKNNERKRNGNLKANKKNQYTAINLLFENWILIFAVIANLIAVAIGRITFDKMTNRDYPGTIYYTIRNVSLYECLGWCRDESDCTAAAFSFVVNPLTPIQETTCLLQNETMAKQKPTNNLGNPNAIGSAGNSGGNNVVGSGGGVGGGSYSSSSLQKAVNMYFFTKMQLRSDNLCNRLWSFERFPNKMLRGLDNAIIYTSNREACLSACLNEVRFVCRSVEFNYLTLQCHLSEYDRRSPVGFPQELIHVQGIDYFENSCLRSEEVCQDQRIYDYAKVGMPFNKVAHYVELNYYPDKELLVKSQGGCLRACTIENEFICRSVLYRPSFKPGQPNCALYHLDHKTFPDGLDTFATPSPIPLLDSGDSSATYFEAGCANDTTKSSNPQQQQQQTLSMTTASMSTSTNHKQTIMSTMATLPPTISTISNIPMIQEGNEPSCDSYGVCYEVMLKCTDTKIVVNVQTSRPFHGRIYALGRSETCNLNVRNSQQFTLDISLGGQDCNTQSLGGMYTNTVVLQHHNVVLTKADKVYHVRCTYETTSRNVTFGMMPVSRDPDTLQITSAPEAPLPKITIFGSDGREATTVRIGDRLSFRIEIPESTPYGIFARSCVAMAKDSRSTFEIIDEHGCPVDNTIFPNFYQVGNALESSYEAFRFTESYGVIFQCNVKYCIGKCEPVICGVGRDNVESWGRRRRSIIDDGGDLVGDDQTSNKEDDDDEMTLSKEILVLDVNENLNNINNSYYSSQDPLMNPLAQQQCASRTSIIVLTLLFAFLIVMYIFTIIYFTRKRWDRATSSSSSPPSSSISSLGHLKYHR